MGAVLSERPATAFANAAPFAGHMDYVPATGQKTTLALLHGFVPNQGNTWDKTRNDLNGFVARMLASASREAELKESAPTRFYALNFALADPPPLATDLIGDYLDFAGLLGRRLAELHLKLTKVSGDPDFTPEVFNDFYRQGLYHGYVGLTARRLEFLRQRYASMEPAVRTLAEKVLEQEPAILPKFNAIFEQRVASERTRYNGRAHLGHVLVTDHDAVLFDFDGDPASHLSERRIKRCPLRDVASMLMSFAYATQFVHPIRRWPRPAPVGALLVQPRERSLLARLLANRQRCCLRAEISGTPADSHRRLFAGTRSARHPGRHRRQTGTRRSAIPRNPPPARR